MSDATAPPPPVTPAGWYDDGQGRLRWWDGRTWTDAYAPVVQMVPAGPRFSGIAITGFVLACASLLLSSLGVLGILLGVFGLIMSIGGYADKKRRGRGFAVAGIIVACVGIALSILLLVSRFT